MGVVARVGQIRAGRGFSRPPLFRGGRGKFGPGRDIPDLPGVGIFGSGRSIFFLLFFLLFFVGVRPGRPAGRAGRALKNGSEKHKIVMEIGRGGVLGGIF